jgi:hypothetical protein
MMAGKIDNGFERGDSRKSHVILIEVKNLLIFVRCMGPIDPSTRLVGRQQDSLRTSGLTKRLGYAKNRWTTGSSVVHHR